MKRRPFGLTVFGDDPIAGTLAVATLYLGMTATVAFGATDEAPSSSSPELAPMLTLGQAQGSPSYSIYDIHVDHLGSTRVMTDINGYIVSEHEYFPFGEAMPPVYLDPTTKRFTGHERDEETGLDYMLARTAQALADSSLRIRSLVHSGSPSPRHGTPMCML